MNNNEMLLLKLGEVVLKGLNRRSFEDKLVKTVLLHDADDIAQAILSYFGHNYFSSPAAIPASSFSRIAGKLHLWWEDLQRCGY